MGKVGKGLGYYSDIGRKTKGMALYSTFPFVLLSLSPARATKECVLRFLALSFYVAGMAELSLSHCAWFVSALSVLLCCDRLPFSFSTQTVRSCSLCLFSF
jgi:hypothetical protein